VSVCNIRLRTAVVARVQRFSGFCAASDDTPVASNVVPTASAVTVAQTFRLCFIFSLQRLYGGFEEASHRLRRARNDTE
jgi:hypothetical protein